MQYLALKIGQVNGVIVNERDGAHTSRSQIIRRRRAQAACAHNQRMRRQDAFLAFDADFFQENVARIAQKLLVVHGK
jgi:hypothetical protein